LAYLTGRPQNLFTPLEVSKQKEYVIREFVYLIGADF